MSSGGLNQGRSVSGGLAFRHRQTGGGQVSLAGMGDRGTKATSLSGLTPIYVRGLFCALRGACRDVVQLEEGGGHVPLLAHTDTLQG